jgi:hypothetical protein
MTSIPNPINAINSINPSKIYGGITNAPLKLFEPFNLIVFLSFYSPIILIVCLVSLSFVFQNFKGLIYLGFLLGCLFVREFVYYISGSKQTISDGTVCSSVQYSKYGNPTFSAFVFAFTIMYLSIPMFTNGGPNFLLFSALLVYFFIDIGIKMYKRCVMSMGDLFINVLLGLASSGLIVTLMYAGGSSKYLFFNEVSSNKDVCSMPSKQTFKCNVFKNGELIGSV